MSARAAIEKSGAKARRGDRREHILLNTPVTDVTVADKQVVVTVRDGKTFTADDAILSVPPPVWSKINFDPAFPVALRHKWRAPSNI